MNPEAVEHIKLYFEKKGYRLDTYESPDDITWCLFSNLDRVAFGFIKKKYLKIDELPIPYEKIYESLSGESFPIFDMSTERYTVYSFPKIYPLEKFCLYVDLLPYES